MCKVVASAHATVFYSINIVMTPSPFTAAARMVYLCTLPTRVCSNIPTPGYPYPYPPKTHTLVQG
ncbi:hypothetical protein L208DRAFT_1385790 [Tricholoma matsutake]|nr:hypothetical protein L208DRAFT_1385790 [Tricholoma matsutake 945]